MFPVSAAFLAALRQPTMQSVVTITTSTGLLLSIQNGSVDMDTTRNIGRTAQLELIPSPTMSADQIYALVMSPNLELTVRRGLMIAGVPELVPLGVFSTDTATKPRANANAVTWAGSDRGKKISAARFTDAYSIASGTTLASAGAALLSSRWAPCPFDFSNVLETIQAPIVWDAGADSDPWDLVRKMFADFGYDLHFDGLGICRAEPVPDPATIAANFDFGVAQTNLITEGNTEGSLTETYNGVICTGEGANIDPPVQGVAWDTDPASPTYYLGGFGMRPYFMSSPILTTAAACLKAAQTTLARVKGSKEQLSFCAVVNPALEPLDLVTSTVAGDFQRLILDKLNIPLKAADSMKATARATSTA